MTPHDFGAVGDGEADDTPAFLAARDWINSTGGRLHIPAGTYINTAALHFVGERVEIVGDGPIETVLTGGGSIHVGRSFFPVLDGFSIHDAIGDSVTIGVLNGPKDYARNHTIRDVTTKGGARGVVFGKAFMGGMTGCVVQGATGAGICSAPGFNTTLTFERTQAMDCGGNGWELADMAYCTMVDVAADRNGGYGFAVQNWHAGTFLGGAEFNAKSAIHFHRDHATDDIIKGMRGVRFTLFEFGNNTSGADCGQLAHFTATTEASLSGCVVFDGTVQRNPVGPSIRVSSGLWHIVAPPSRNSIRAETSGNVMLLDGATDVGGGKPKSVWTGGTAVAQLRNKAGNAPLAFGGEVLVTAASNPKSQSARNATYKLLISRGVGVSECKLIGSAGNTAGATADSAGFTFAIDLDTNRLIATRVGQAGSGPWFFTFACLGDIHAEPL